MSTRDLFWILAAILAVYAAAWVVFLVSERPSRANTARSQGQGPYGRPANRDDLYKRVTNVPEPLLRARAEIILRRNGIPDTSPAEDEPC